MLLVALYIAEYTRRARITAESGPQIPLLQAARFFFQTAAAAAATSHKYQIQQHIMPTKDYQPLRSVAPEPLDTDPSPELREATAHGSATTVFQLGHLVRLSVADFRYITFMALGISLLWPWNCLISLSAHYAGKFNAADGDMTTRLGGSFASSLMTVSTLTTLSANAYLTTRQNHAHFPHRILYGCLVTMAVFALLAVLETVVPDHEYGVLYFLMFMVLVFISSLGTALAQNGTMSIANVLGARYAQGVMVGQATAGVLPSLSLMVSNYMYYGKTDAGSGSMSIVLYFLLTVLVALVAGVLFFICDRIDDDVVDFEVVVPKLTRHVPFRTLFKKLKWSALAIFTVFLFSLVFPIFAGQVTSVHSGGRLTEDSVFIPFAFFVWNLGDLTGRVVCSYPRLVVDSDKKLFTYSLLRSLLIPLFFLCNLQDATPRVPSDLFYLAVQFVFGFTNGHCVSSSFMGVGKYVSGEELEASGAFCNVFLSMGLLGGSLLSYVFDWM